MAEMTYAQRLAAVRACMAAQGIDAFVLQRTDQHNSEYLPAAEERVAWLTGFTGSSAFVALTSNQAAVFSDGRYTVQLEDEVDAALFERQHSINEPVVEWLVPHLTKGQKLGLDPYLTKQRERDVYAKLANRAGAELVMVAANPIDEVWDDLGRPRAPLEPVSSLALAYAGDGQTPKCLAMGDALTELGVDCILITASDEIAWLLNIRGADIPFNPLCLSHAILDTAGRVNWFVSPEKLTNKLALGGEVEIVAPIELDAELRKLGQSAKRVLMDPASVHEAFAECLIEAGGEVVRAASPIVLAKACKNPVELEGARRAQARDALAIVRFLHWLSDIPLDGTVSELDAVERLAMERGRLDLHQGPSFDTISAHGPNSALPHYRVSAASNRPLTGGTLYLVDSGGQYLDGTTDITRTIAMGDVDFEMRQRFTAVLKGHIALARAIFPHGTHGGQLDILARQPLWEQGLDFDHGTGHGIGAYLCVHEGPQRIAKMAAGAPLKPGMIISNEPGYYKSGHYGIRIENLVIVEERTLNKVDARPMLGFETITLAPIDQRLIEPDMLSDVEIAWLDHYHAEVCRRLIPQLDDLVGHWLKQVCQPLKG